MIQGTLRWGLVAWLLGTACSGGIKYKVSEAKVADLPTREKQRLLLLQSERERTQSEVEKARTDLMIAEHALDDAQVELGQARMGAQKILAELDGDPARREHGRLIRLQAELRVAKLAEDVAEARLRWCRQRRIVSQAQLAVAESHAQLAEAQVQKERAQLAARHGRLPVDKVATPFDEQVAEAASLAARRRQSVMQLLAGSDVIEQEFNQKQELYSQARTLTPSYSPLKLPPGEKPPLPLDE